MRELIEIYESGYSDSDINDMLISDPDILKLSDNYIIYIVREKDKDRWLHTGDGLDLIEIERVISMFESGDLKVSSDQTLNKPRYFAYRGGAGYHYCVYDI